MKKSWNLSLLLVFVTLMVSAQDGYKLKKDSIQSEVLKQNRKFSIFLPEGYEAGNSRFPVIYVLDADGRDQHIVPTARFLFLNNKMPKAIIIGVDNIDRNHDFLPDSSSNGPTGGGADNFIRFFKDELIPHVEKNLKTESYRVLIGHSYGGLFAMHALLTSPELFDAYIAIDPSFWYKKQMMIGTARNEFIKAKNWDRSIFISGREGGGMEDMGITPMEKLLKSSAPKDLSWKVVTYPNEDHGSVTFKSAYDGLRYIFDSGGNFMVLPQSGIIPKGASSYAIIENLSPGLRYTLDGTEPGKDSPLCKEKITITMPCTLKVKSIATKYNKKPAVSVIFSEGEYMKGKPSADNLKPGLKYTYYEGVWDSIPDFSKLTAKSNGVTENIDLKFALKRDSFAVKFEGYLHITEKKLYDLWITSDDGSRLYLNNQLLFDNNGLHSADNPLVKLVPLTPGYYPITIEYFERAGDESVTFGMVEGKKKLSPVPIPKELLFHAE